MYYFDMLDDAIAWVEETVDDVLKLVGIREKDGEYKPDAPVHSEGLEYTSSGIGTCTDTDIVIPSVSPNSDRVMSIGDYTFYNCTGLTSMTIPDSMMNIGEDAFGFCFKLTIYCETAEQLSGWHEEWNPNNLHVEWGYTS